MVFLCFGGNLQVEKAGCLDMFVDFHLALLASFRLVPTFLKAQDHPKNNLAKRKCLETANKMFQPGVVVLPVQIVEGREIFLYSQQQKEGFRRVLHKLAPVAELLDKMPCNLYIFLCI